MHPSACGIASRHDYVSSTHVDTTIELTTIETCARSHSGTSTTSAQPQHDMPPQVSAPSTDDQFASVCDAVRSCAAKMHTLGTNCSCSAVDLQRKLLHHNNGPNSATCVQQDPGCTMLFERHRLQLAHVRGSAEAGCFAAVLDTNDVVLGVARGGPTFAEAPPEGLGVPA